MVGAQERAKYKRTSGADFGPLDRVKYAEVSCAPLDAATFSIFAYSTIFWPGEAPDTRPSIMPLRPDPAGVCLWYAGERDRSRVTATHALARLAQHS